MVAKAGGVAGILVTFVLATAAGPPFSIPGFPLAVVVAKVVGVACPLQPPAPAFSFFGFSIAFVVAKAVGVAGILVKFVLTAAAGHLFSSFLAFPLPFLLAKAVGFAEILVTF